MSDIYKNKYIKYKKKFLDLKNTNFELNQQGGELKQYEIKLFEYIEQKNVKKALELLTEIQKELFDPTGFNEEEKKKEIDFSKIIDFNMTTIQKDINGDTYLHAAIKSLAAAAAEAAKLLIYNESGEESARLAAEAALEAFANSLRICEELINTINLQIEKSDSSRLFRFKIFSTENKDGQIPLVYALQKLQRTTALKRDAYASFYRKIIKMLFENTINSVDQSEEKKSLIENVKGNYGNLVHHNEKREGKEFGKVILKTKNKTLEDKVKKELNLLIKYYNFSIDKEIIDSWIDNWYEGNPIYFLHAAIDSIADPNKKANQYTNGQILINLIEGTEASIVDLKDLSPDLKEGIEEASFVDSGHESNEIPLIYALDKLPLPDKDGNPKLITNYKEIISSLFEKTKQQFSNDILLKRYLETAESGKNKRSKKTSKRLNLLIKRYNSKTKGWINDWYKDITKITLLEAAAAAAAKSSVGKTLASFGSISLRSSLPTSTTSTTSPTTSSSEGGGDCKYVAGTFGHWHSI